MRSTDWAPSLGATDEGSYLWQEWLTPALADGSFKLSPRPEIAGQGLEALQGAVDAQFGRIHMLGLKTKESKSITTRKLVVEIN